MPFACVRLEARLTPNPPTLYDPLGRHTYIPWQYIPRSLMETQGKSRKCLPRAVARLHVQAYPQPFRQHPPASLSIPISATEHASYSRHFSAAIHDFHMRQLH
jgi:hypothetical protein